MRVKHAALVETPPDPPDEVLADSDYGTGEALAALEEAGQQPLVKPWPVTATIPGGFGIDNFTVDEAAGTATYPAAVTRPFRGPVGHFRRRLPRLPTAGPSARPTREDPTGRPAAPPQRPAGPCMPIVERTIAWLTAHAIGNSATAGPRRTTPGHHRTTQKTAGPGSRRHHPLSGRLANAHTNSSVPRPQTAPAALDPTSRHPLFGSPSR